MKKALALALALLVATPAWADYRYNPYTGKLDYYEKTDLTDYLTEETDPVYSGSWAHSINSTDITNLSHLSGTNTGDQDLSPYALKTDYLALDQTTPQTTVGTFSFPSVVTTGLTKLATNSGNVLIGTSTNNTTGYTFDGITYYQDKIQNNGGTLLGGTVLISEAGSAATRKTHYGIPYALEIQFNSGGAGYSYPMGFKNLDGIGGEFAFTSFSGSVAWATAGTVMVENPKGAMGFCPSGDVRFTTNGWTATPSIIAKKVSDGNDKIGINTSAPDKALEVNLGTSSALRLTYNDKNGSASKYADFTVASTGATTITNTANIFTFGNGVADTDITLNFTGTTNSGAFKWMEDEDYFQFSDDIKMADNETIVLGGTGYVDSPSYKVGGVAGITASGTSCTITAITGGIITGATCS